MVFTFFDNALVCCINTVSCTELNDALLMFEADLVLLSVHEPVARRV